MKRGKGGGQQPGDNVDEAGCATVHAHGRDGGIVNVVAGPAQSGTDHLDCIGRGNPARLEPDCNRQHVVFTEGILQFGQRTKRQAEPLALSVQLGFDFAPARIDHLSSYIRLSFICLRRARGAA